MEIRKRSESRKEPVRRWKALDQAGKERVVEEVAAFRRTCDDQGNWSEWVQGSNEFWCDGGLCVKQGEREVVPIMSEDVLTLQDDA